MFFSGEFFPGRFFSSGLLSGVFFSSELYSLFFLGGIFSGCCFAWIRQENERSLLEIMCFSELIMPGLSMNKSFALQKHSSLDTMSTTRSPMRATYFYTHSCSAYELLNSPSPLVVKQLSLFVGPIQYSPVPHTNEISGNYTDS